MAKYTITSKSQRGGGCLHNTLGTLHKGVA